MTDLEAACIGLLLGIGATVVIVVVVQVAAPIAAALWRVSKAWLNMRRTRRAEAKHAEGLATATATGAMSINESRTLLGYDEPAMFLEFSGPYLTHEEAQAIADCWLAELTADRTLILPNGRTVTMRFNSSPLTRENLAE